MMEAPNLKKAFLDIEVNIQNRNNHPLYAYIMDENNFFSYQAGGMFQALAADTSIAWPSDGVWVTTPGNYYWVADNTADSIVKRARVLFTIGHYAQVPK
jgi:hypothetical protein